MIEYMLTICIHNPCKPCLVQPFPAALHLLFSLPPSLPPSHVCVKLFIELQCSNAYTAQWVVEVSKVILSECSTKTLHNHLPLSTEVIKLHTDCY